MIAIHQANIAASTTGDHTIVAAVTGKRIRVLNLMLSWGGTVNVTWKSDSDTICGAIPGAANLVICGAFGLGVPSGYFFETAAGEALVMNLSGNVAVGGTLNYVLIDS